MSTNGHNERQKEIELLLASIKYTVRTRANAASVLAHSQKIRILCEADIITASALHKAGYLTLAHKLLQRADGNLRSLASVLNVYQTQISMQCITPNCDSRIYFFTPDEVKGAHGVIECETCGKWLKRLST